MITIIMGNMSYVFRYILYLIFIMNEMSTYSATNPITCHMLNEQLEHCFVPKDCLANGKTKHHLRVMSMTCRISASAPIDCCLSSGKSRNSTVQENIARNIVKRRFWSTKRQDDTAIRQFTVPWALTGTKNVSKDILQLARMSGLRKLFQRERKELELLSKGIKVQKGTPEYLHQFFLKSTPESLKQAADALIQDEIIRVIVSRTKNGKSLESLLQSFRSTRRQAVGVNSIVCKPRPQPCAQRDITSKYRTMDGSCNNAQNRMWGQSSTAFQRLLAPQYADGFSRPRMAMNGVPLASPRKISTSCIGNGNRASPLVTVLIMNWGQFLNHDITLTPLNTLTNGEGIKCCTFLRHEECFPIDIPRDDPFFTSMNQTCMEFVRSLPASSHRKSCEFGFRDQMNEVTSYIDGSVVYGSSENMARQLRSFRGGLLQTINCFGNEYLPFAEGDSSRCSQPFQLQRAGDIRTTEQIHLVALHTVMVREHNRIAKQLSSLNPHWNDETLFRESRRIIGAIIQHITYNEYLPLILGKRMMSSLQLMPRSKAYTTDYNPEVNAGILNEFSGAANRFGHSLIPNALVMLDENDAVEGEVRVRDQFAFPVPLYFPKNLDRVLRGTSSQPVQLLDTHVSHEVTKHLYQTANPFGLDLAAVNIQRGRDHGLPGYNAYRQFCGLKKATTFDDFLPEMDNNIVRNLKQVYRSVDDVDLWMGAISERSLKGALVGPVLGCLLVEQFWRLKVGDRYWYEYKHSPGAFTTAQLGELRKISLARLMCDNGDNIKTIQPVVFIQKTSWNRRIPCTSDDILSMNLSPWKE